MDVDTKGVYMKELLEALAGFQLVFRIEADEDNKNVEQVVLRVERVSTNAESDESDTATPAQRNLLTPVTEVELPTTPPGSTE